MAGFMDIIADKLGMRGQGGGQGGGDKSQFMLAGALVLVIIVSVTIVFSSLGGKKHGSKGPQEMKFKDIETGEIITIDPKTADPSMFMAGPGMLAENPNTGKRTLAPMMKCPACEKWFISESMMEEGGMMMPDMTLECTECGTDINEYYRQKRKSRKK